MAGECPNSTAADIRLNARSSFASTPITPLSWAAIVEEVVELKVDLKGVNTNYEKQPFKVTVFRDDAATVPVPFIILGHGRDTQDKNKSFGRISFPDHAKWLV